MKNMKNMALQAMSEWPRRRLAGIQLYIYIEQT